MPESDRSRALLGALTATLMWSCAGLLVKWTKGHPLAVCGLRSLIATPILLAFLRRPHFTWSVPQIAAALAHCITMIGFVVAVGLTTAANAVLLQYTAPIYVALLSGWLLRERITWADWLSVGVVLGGLVLFFLDRLSFSGLAGNLVAIGTGFTFALMLIFLRKQKGGSPMESILLGNSLAALVGLPFALLHPPPAASWPGILLMALVLLSIPFVLYTRAIRKLTALEAILIKGLEPVLNPLWVFLVIGESPGRWALLGGTIVFLAVTLRAAFGALRSRRGQPPPPVHA